MVGDHMTGRQHDILRQLQSDVCDETKPISAALRTCMLLADMTETSALRAWAAKELNGYPNRDDVPDYRRVGADLQAYGRDRIGRPSRDIPVSMFDIPSQLKRPHMKDEVVLREGVGWIEELLGEADDYGRLRIKLPLSRETAQLMTAYKRETLAGARYEDMYWNASQASIRSVLDQVRNKLAAFVGELLITLPDDQSVPSKQAAENAFNVMIAGNANGVVFNNAQAARGATNTATVGAGADGPAAEKESLATRIWKLIVDLSVVGSCLLGGAAVVFAYLMYKIAVH
ncbi:hypothetical protein ABZ832_28360 [Streptantibioticus parmotrematis]|uniref:AbiTii domain-containing protein n=1 Tax=Streptantibioticus parmotrematis TaxID=2873249 RepID=UPI0033C0EF18